MVLPAGTGFAEVDPDTVRMAMFTFSSTNLQARRDIETCSHRGHSRGEGSGENKGELHIGDGLGNLAKMNRCRGEGREEKAGSV